MLENMFVVLVQVLTLFALMSIGYVLAKMKKIDDNAVSSISYILVYIVTPCVIINAMQVESNDSMLANMGITGLFSIFMYAFSIAIAHFSFNKEKEDLRISLKFCTIYNNTGYMGFPLLGAVLGSKSLVYAAVAIAVFNLIVWSHGVVLMSSKKEMSLKNALITPGTVGLSVGLILFLTQWKMPSMVGNSVSMLADLNTPVAMILLGTYMAKAKLSQTFTRLAYYKLALNKLIIIPTIVFLSALALNAILPTPIDSMVICSSVILSSAPTAVISSILANRYNRDTVACSQVITLTTILSIITMPVFAALVQQVYGL